MQREALLNPLNKKSFLNTTVKQTLPYILLLTSCGYTWWIINEKSFSSLFHYHLFEPTITQLIPTNNNDSTLPAEEDFEESFSPVRLSILTDHELWNEKQTPIDTQYSPSTIPEKKSQLIMNQVINYKTIVDSLDITGVKLSETPKVLINNRAYTLNEWIPLETPLQVIKIEARKITLLAPDGIIYEKYWK